MSCTEWGSYLSCAIWCQCALTADVIDTDTYENGIDTQRVSVCLSDGVGDDLLHTEGQCVPE